MAYGYDTSYVGTDTQPYSDSTATSSKAVRALDNPTQDDQLRIANMAKAWQAYLGNLPDPLKQQKDGLNDNARSNRLKPMVQKGASFLFPPTLTFSVQAKAKRTTAPTTGIVQTGQDDAQETLDRFWKRNRQQSLLHKLAINGGVFGQAFLLLIPCDDGDDDDSGSAGGKSASVPRLQLIDPQNVRVETVPGDVEMVMCYVISYRQYDAGMNRMRECRKVIERNDPDGDAAKGMFDDDATWTITDQERTGGNSAPWVTTDQQEWEYPFPPLFDCQNLPVPCEYWGEADITLDLIEQNMAINFVQSNISRILKWHASPLTIGTGLRAGQIDRSPDNILTLPEGATMFNLEMKSDLQSSLNFLNTLRANMDEQDRTPAVALGRQEELPKGNISGVALDLMFQPLVEKTNQKRSCYGPMLEDLCGAVLVLCGYGKRLDDVPVNVQWPTVLPVDPQVEWQTAQLKMQVGVSKTTIMEEGGYDPDQEAMLREEEQASDMRAMMAGKMMPPAPPMPMQPGQPGDDGTGNGGNMPPVNNPAAVAARARMSAAFGKGQ